MTHRGRRRDECRPNKVMQGTVASGASLAFASP